MVTGPLIDLNMMAMTEGRERTEMDTVTCFQDLACV
jgi:hypothetical protein